MNIKISVPSQGQPKNNVGVSKCRPIRNIGINISYIFDFTGIQTNFFHQEQAGPLKHNDWGPIPN